MAGTQTYGMRELQGLVGVQPRTLRHWVKKRLLPKPVGRGRGARYTQGHVLRAKVIRQLRAKGLSLGAIRTKLEALSEEQLVVLLPREQPNGLTGEGMPGPPPATTYPFVSWEVVTLMDGLVLLVNGSKAPGLRRVVDDIYRHYAGPVPRRQGASS
jgi:DNA-binding transcriptional MerR regulator